MGCEGCAKKKRAQEARVRKRDHDALQVLRQLREPGAAWEFDGTTLRLVRPGDNPMQEERYGDPADAIIYWAGIGT